MFRGFTATAARDAPYAGMYMAFYEKGKDVLGKSNGWHVGFQNAIRLRDRLDGPRCDRPKFVEIGSGLAKRHDSHRLGNVGGHAGDTSNESS